MAGYLVPSANYRCFRRRRGNNEGNYSSQTVVSFDPHPTLLEKVSVRFATNRPRGGSI